MVLKIIEMLIPKSNKRNRPGAKRVPRTITIHDTQNYNVRANALAHARLQVNGNARQASWHLQVDDEPEIYLSVPYDEVAYAAGDGSGPGNSYSIHIEMAVNKDGNYKKTVANTIELARYLLNKYPSITDVDVVQHNKWSGKDCPKYLRSGFDGINWTDFVKGVRDSKAEVTKPSTPPKYVTTNNKFKIGQKVKIKSSAKNYATGQTIPSRFKNKTYTIKQRGSNRMLIKELYSWVSNSDLEVVGGSVSKPKPTVKKHAKLRIDGYMGKLTISALQRYFGTPVDGVLSKPSLVIKALQRFLGTVQDGYISKPRSNMVSAMQRRFGTPIDGKLSRPSLVIKELQRRLNQGKL